MRIKRPDCKFDRPVVRQKADQTTGGDIVGDEEGRGQRNTDPLQGCKP